MTGDSPGGASTNAGRPPACSVWLLVGPPWVLALGSPADAERECRRPLLLPLQGVPHRAGLPGGDSGLGGGFGWSRRATRPDDRVDAGVAAVPGSPAPGGATGLGVGPHPLEWCHPRRDPPDDAADGGLGRDGAALASRGGLGVAARPADSARYRPAPSGTMRTSPLGFRTPPGVGGPHGCRRTRYPPPPAGGGSLDAQRHAA